MRPLRLCACGALLLTAATATAQPEPQRPGQLRPTPPDKPGALASRLRELLSPSAAAGRAVLMLEHLGGHSSSNPHQRPGAVAPSVAHPPACQRAGG